MISHFIGDHAGRINPSSNALDAASPCSMQNACSHHLGQDAIVLCVLPPLLTVQKSDPFRSRCPPLVKVGSRAPARVRPDFSDKQTFGRRSGISEKYHSHHSLQRGKAVDYFTIAHGLPDGTDVPVGPLTASIETNAPG